MIPHYKKIGYNINVLQQTACLVVDPITVGKNSKWVWSGTTTITNRRQPSGTAGKSPPTLLSSLIARPWVGLQTLWRFRLKDLSVDEMVGVWCFDCLSGLLGFTCWIFLLWYSVLFTVESLSLLYLLFISWFICFRRWLIDKLGVFHAKWKIVSMIRKYHNHTPQTTLWHREEEPLNHHKAPGRQIIIPCISPKILLESTNTYLNIIWQLWAFIIFTTLLKSSLSVLVPLYTLESRL